MQIDPMNLQLDPGYLQHGFDLRCFLEISTRLRSHLVDCDAIRKLDEGEPVSKVDIEHTLSHVSTLYTRTEVEE